MQCSTRSPPREPKPFEVSNEERNIKHEQNSTYLTITVETDPPAAGCVPGVFRLAHDKPSQATTMSCALKPVPLPAAAKNPQGTVPSAAGLPGHPRQPYPRLIMMTLDIPLLVAVRSTSPCAESGSRSALSMPERRSKRTCLRVCLGIDHQSGDQDGIAI